MLQFILTIGAIALFALVLNIGINHVDLQAPERHRVHAKMQSGFGTLHSGFSSYLIEQSSLPTTSGWETELDDYIDVPAPVDGVLSWSYTETNGKAYFCLSGIFDDVHFKAAQKLDDSLNSFYLDSSCGATTTSAPPSTFPLSYAATYWVRP